MITAIREMRRARGLTLDEVARACVPPTTAQTIGRLETGTRTVSIDWLRRIATALGVEPADLVRLPDRADLPVAAILDGAHVHAPRHDTRLPLPGPTPGAVAVTVASGCGDYRAGDVLWCDPLAPEAWAAALHHDVLAPLPAGRFAFGRLLAVDPPAMTLLPPASGSRPVTIAGAAWAARVVRLVREL
jgi:transcriptional regulator with XRE-family HTH domain